jgi:hypothetical protein
MLASRYYQLLVLLLMHVQTTCESLAVAQTARNYPIINHGR